MYKDSDLALDVYDAIAEVEEEKELDPTLQSQVCSHLFTTITSFFLLLFLLSSFSSHLFISLSLSRCLFAFISLYVTDLQLISLSFLS